MTGLVLCVLLSQAPLEPAPALADVQADAGVAPIDSAPAAMPAPNPEKIEKIEQAFAEPHADEIDQAFALETPRHVRVTLKDGRVIEGKLLIRDGLQMLILTEGGNPVQVDTDQVTRFEEPLPNLNRSRYLATGSALMPEVGQITLTQMEVFATVFEVGISENFSFQLGGALPGYFLGSDGVNAFAAVKFGAAVHKWVHVSLDLKFLGLGLLGRIAGPATSAVPAAGLIEATGTLGSENLNVTVSVGPPFNLAQISTGGQVVTTPLFIVSAFARVAQNVGLITENWFVPDIAANPDGTHGWFISDALGARFFGQRWCVDLGLLVLPSQFRRPSAVPPCCRGSTSRGTSDLAMSMLKNLRELYQYRALLWSLTLRELRARYRASVLGFMWTFLNPTLSMAVYALVFGVLLPQHVDKFPYFIFIGLLPWIFFSSSVSGGSSSVSDRRDLLTKVRFPAQVLPATVVATNLANYVLSLPLLVALGLVYGVVPTWHALFFIPLVCLQTLFTLAVTYLLSALNVAFRDLQHIVANLLQLLFF